MILAVRRFSVKAMLASRILTKTRKVGSHPENNVGVEHACEDTETQPAIEMVHPKSNARIKHYSEDTKGHTTSTGDG